MPHGTAARLLDLLRSRGQSLGTAESLTGGMLGSIITSVAGASDVYVGGVISYATEVKQAVLGVAAETVSAYGVVSAECAVEMAEGAKRALGADWAVSTTGVAGPDAQESKPVGLVYVGVAGPSRSATRELRLSGDRMSIREAACEAALQAMIETVSGAD